MVHTDAASLFDGDNMREKPTYEELEQQVKDLYWGVLRREGYNFALSDVEEACKELDHPELTEDDTSNYHKWAEPYTRRCYCGAVGYTNEGRFYACKVSEEFVTLMKKFNPEYRNRFRERYIPHEPRS